MIDLHLHTTASDGLLSPAALVARVRDAGVPRWPSPTTTRSTGSPRRRTRRVRRGLRLLTGVEVTAVDARSDVHILGYGVDPTHAIREFLADQRATRVARLHRMLERLAALGMPIEPASWTPARRQPASPTPRPVAWTSARRAALVEAGFVSSVQEAFDAGSRAIGRRSFRVRARRRGTWSR